MSKVYKTKTGIELRVIQGGQSELETMTPVFDEFNQKLLNQFGKCRIDLRSVSYIGLSVFELQVEVKIDAQAFDLTKDKSKLLGLITLDLGNYLSRFHGLNEFVRPEVDAKRAKNGVKVLNFIYRISESTALSMGLDVNHGHKLIQRGA